MFALLVAIKLLAQGKSLFISWAYLMSGLLFTYLGIGNFIFVNDLKFDEHNKRFKRISGLRWSPKIYEGNFSDVSKLTIVWVGRKERSKWVDVKGITSIT